MMNEQSKVADLLKQTLDDYRKTLKICRMQQDEIAELKKKLARAREIISLATDTIIILSKHANKIQEERDELRRQLDEKRNET